MTTPSKSRCSTCGYEWPSGQDGNHSCADKLLAELKAHRNASMEMSEKANEQFIALANAAACLVSDTANAEGSAKTSRALLIKELEDSQPFLMTTSKKSDTPLTDAAMIELEDAGRPVAAVKAEFARQLERSLAEKVKELEIANQALQIYQSPDHADEVVGLCNTNAALSEQNTSLKSLCGEAVKALKHAKEFCEAVESQDFQSGEWEVPSIPSSINLTIASAKEQGIE